MSEHKIFLLKYDFKKMNKVVVIESVFAEEGYEGVYLVLLDVLLSTKFTLDTPPSQLTIPFAALPPLKSQKPTIIFSIYSRKSLINVTYRYYSLQRQNYPANET